MSDCIYAGMITAKNGTDIPVFKNDRAFFSTYNPERDADNFIIANKDAFDTAGCILVGGIGNGLHIQKLAETYPETRIIAFEADAPSLAFSCAHLYGPLSNELHNAESRIILTSADCLQETLPAHYIPALHGNFAFAAVRSWSDYLGNEASVFIAQINAIISDISADYSVQAQFGKLWHKNILRNVALYDELKNEQKFHAASFVTDAHKAAVIGAGPSLDNTIHILSENRSEYCIFATDTSFSTLRAAGITPDFVVTVDSQQISEKHFIGQSFKGTILAADLTANSSIIENAADQDTIIFLFHNHHPLSRLFESWLNDIPDSENPFPFIDSGAGTVLHAATDLARKLGFSEIEFFGADFAYSEGRPYVKGTYLEKLYYTDESRTGNAETAYSRLMYRGPVISLSESFITTEVLQRYKAALEAYLQKGCTLLNQVTENHNSAKISCNKHFFDAFYPWYLEKLQKKDKKVLFSVLPLAAWYKKYFPDADTECVYAFAEQQTANVGRIQCRLQKK